MCWKWWWWWFPKKPSSLENESFYGLSEKCRTTTFVDLKTKKPYFRKSHAMISDFLREYRALQRIARFSCPPSICVYVDVDFSSLSFVFPLYSGDLVWYLSILDETSSEKTTVSLSLFLKFFSQIAQALTFLHSHQIQHNDVKPDNILVNLSTQQALLTDFEYSGPTHKFQQGTPVYIAPELVFPGEQSIFGKNDIYSFGITMNLVLLENVYSTVCSFSRTPFLRHEHYSFLHHVSFAHTGSKYRFPWIQPDFPSALDLRKMLYRMTFWHASERLSLEQCQTILFRYLKQLKM